MARRPLPGDRLINAVRAAGANNVVICGGINYSNNLTWWGSNKPTDPAKQLGAAIHLYSGGYPNNFANGSASTDAMLAANLPGVPLVVTEFGDTSGSGTGAYTKSLTAWADAHGYSLTAWTWNPWGQSSNDLIQNASSYAPTVGFGQTYHDWAFNHL
jgi:hypothetical protein